MSAKELGFIIFVMTFSFIGFSIIAEIKSLSIMIKEHLSEKWNKKQPIFTNKDFPANIASDVASLGYSSDSYRVYLNDFRFFREGSIYDTIKIKPGIIAKGTEFTFFRLDGIPAIPVVMSKYSCSSEEEKSALSEQDQIEYETNKEIDKNAYDKYRLEMSEFKNSFSESETNKHTLAGSIIRQFLPDNMAYVANAIQFDISVSSNAEDNTTLAAAPFAIRNKIAGSCIYSWNVGGNANPTLRSALLKFFTLHLGGKQKIKVPMFFQPRVSAELKIIFVKDVEVLLDNNEEIAIMCNLDGFTMGKFI